MKKLGKLYINPEKVIKNEELVNLRGGYDEDLCNVYCGNTLISSPYRCAWEECSIVPAACDCIEDDF
jgi:hypothetical protein